MVSAPFAVSAGAIAGITAAVIVVFSLVASAIIQYRRAQDRIAEKRRLHVEAEAEASEQRRLDRLRDAEIMRIAFGTRRERVRNHRPELVSAAARFVGDDGTRWMETTLLVPDRWMLPAPLAMGPGGAAVVATPRPESGVRRPAWISSAIADAWPLTSKGLPADHVVDLIDELEQPPAGRYVNRDCYRVTGLSVAPDRVAFELGLTTYFAALDEAVPLECEIAEAMEDEREFTFGFDGILPFRDAIGDPFDVAARTTVASVSTLVLRRAPDGSAEFWLHRRRTVGMLSGQTHVVPTGVFQPAIDDLPEVFVRDAHPWWTVVRESAEELLGMRNVDERSLGDDVYDTLSPLSDLEAARRDGAARPWLVGLGLDPLSLWLELLTVLVVDAAAFDRIIGQPPRENGEGTLVGRTRSDGTFGGLPFTNAGIADALATADLAPAADGLLRLAAKHRDALLLGSV